MPQVFGNIKTNKITLQEKGSISTGDLVMEVLNNEFTMSMGSNILMTLSPDDVSDINDSSTNTNTVLTILKDTVIEGSLDILNEVSIGSSTGPNIVLNAQISGEMKTTLTSICNAGAWQPSYGQSNNFLPYGSNIYSPVAAVHIWKNGDSWEYNAGKLNASSTSPSVDANTIYYWGSMTKTVTALLYARLKTLGVIPPGHAVKVSDVFPTMKDITYVVPSFSSTSNATTLCVNPFDASTWVNLTPTTRELYLEDVLSESVGFASTEGDDYTYNRPSLGGSNPMAAYNIASSNVYGSSTVGLYQAITTAAISTIALEPTTNFTNYIAKFSNGGVLQGKPCILYRPHGVFNYNSSGNISSASLLQFYRNKYPASSNMSYFDVLKKELLDPVDTNLFYYFNSPSDSRFAKIPATWKPALDNSGYIVDTTWDISQSVYPKLGFLYRAATYSPNSLLTVRNYHGNFGLFGTKEDYSKVVRLLALDGLTSSGVRLINAKEIANLRIPRVTIDESSSSLSLYEFYKSYASTYALGGFSRGPSYASAYTTEPDFQRMINIDSMGILPNAEVGTITFDDCPKNEFGWGGVAGTLCFICAETRTVAIITTQEETNAMGRYKVINPIRDVLYNDYVQPSALTVNI